MSARKDYLSSLALLLLSISACADTTYRSGDEGRSDDAPRALVAQAPSDDATDADEPADAADSTDAPLDVPAPVSVPAVWGFGIGVSDVPNAVKFYTDVMQMTVEKQDVKRDGYTETVMYATQAKRGARIVLMRFDDARNTRKITAKLVFQASNTAAVNRAAARFPDYKSRVNIGIVQFDGPDTYIHEVGGIFDTGGNARVPYPVALGFSVSNLASARRFYTSLGMKESRIGSFRVTDASGSGSISEFSERFTEGAGLVLQSWSPARNAKDNPLKVVFMVPDAQAMADKIVAGGGAIVKAAERSPVYDNRLVVVAKDADGYVLELVQ